MLPSAPVQAGMASNVETAPIDDKPSHAPQTSVPGQKASTAQPAAPAALSLSAESKGSEAKPGQLTRQRLEETRQWLESVDDNRWFIQLLSTDSGSIAHVESFLGNAARLVDSGELRIYSAERNGVKRLGIIYGSYASREAASKAMNDLPAELKTHGPYPRQVRRLRN
jgi:septal ring-binding cell division protein DamX